MRIHITGNAGSGKTTLAKQISNRLGIPAFGLDAIVWQQGWHKTPTAERLLAEQKLVTSDRWVIEGVSATVREAASYVIFLDFPRRTCYLRCFKRNLPYLFRSRPGLPQACPEILIIPRLLKLIWNFPKLAKPLIEKGASQDGFIRLTTRSQVADFLSQLQSVSLSSHR